MDSDINELVDHVEAAIKLRNLVLTPEEEIERDPWLRILVQSELSDEEAADVLIEELRAFHLVFPLSRESVTNLIKVIRARWLIHKEGEGEDTANDMFVQEGGE